LATFLTAAFFAFFFAIDMAPCHEHQDTRHTTDPLVLYRRDRATFRTLFPVFFVGVKNDDTTFLETISSFLETISARHAVFTREL
jgi:hypothetical protein